MKTWPFIPSPTGSVVILAAKGTNGEWGIAKAASKKANPSPVVVATCPEQKPCDCDKDQSSFYYNKLVNYLFSKSKRLYDDFDDKLLISIHLQVTREQMKALSSTTNPQDIDAIVFQVIENSKDGLVVQANEILLSWYDRLHYGYLTVLNSQSAQLVLFVSLFLISALGIRLICRINFIAVFVISLIVISLVYKYLDCNRRLEYENHERIKTLANEPNPCERSTKFLGLVNNYNAEKCTAYMMQVNFVLLFRSIKISNHSNPFQVSSRTRSANLRPSWFLHGLFIGSVPKTMHQILREYRHVCGSNIRQTRIR